jgi:hypothetical protein
MNYLKSECKMCSNYDNEYKCKWNCYQSFRDNKSLEETDKNGICKYFKKID